MSEIWKDISGYEGLYQVSNLGRVKSLRDNHFKMRNKILKPNKNRDGYLQICLYKNGIKKVFRVHRLVAETFVSNPHVYTEVNHKDEDKTNNNASNLEWCSREYNIRYGRRTEKTSKSVNQYDLDGNFIKTYKSISEVSRIFKTQNTTNIADVCNGKRKTAYKYIWKWNGGVAHAK